VSGSHFYNVGDPVIYALPKKSRQPGPRARSIQPARMGDDYSYVVDKYWRVAEVLPENTVRLVTRRGKVRIASVNDPLLRPAGWLEKLLYRNRFPEDAVVSRVLDHESATVVSEVP
jgi:hypothetical protein